MKNYSFFDKIILRTPLKTVETNITWDKIQAVFQQKLFREALFVGSPSLYQLLEQYEQDTSSFSPKDLEALKISLYKYYSRFSNRCTPFGLFAMVSTLNLSKETNIDVPASSIRKSTKFDTFFLANLLQVIDKVPEIREQLFYKVNSSLYSVSDKYRYVEYYMKKEVRLHKISGVDKNDYLDKVVEMAGKGIQLKALATNLANEQVTVEQVTRFLHTLVDNQFLVSELEVNITGDDYLERLIQILSEERFSSFEAKTVLSLLLDIHNRLKKIEQNNNGTIQEYLDLFEFVNQQFESVPVDKLFQVDTYRNLGESSLGYSTLKKLRTAAQVINRLSSEVVQANLESFKKKFVERYEEYEMPLAQVLDPDVGIGYAKSLGAKTPLVEGLSISGQGRKSIQIDWDKKRSMMLQKLLHCYQMGATNIELKEADINAFEEREDAYFDTFSIFFNAFRENGVDKIHAKSLWGPSANNVIGRFAHLDESIYDLNDSIAQTENALYRDKIVAEIVHLPQARVGNVLHRKNNRAYEIPYLGKSSLPAEQQLSINDLTITVKHGQIILRSKSLGKEIIPRLSNAHNYPANALPIYHFLCDLQMQNSQALGFSFGALNYEYSFIPRVSFKDIILSRATWHLSKQEIQSLLKNKHSETHLSNFIQQKKLPKVIAFVKGDNEVVINFDNELSRTVFYSMIKNKGFAELKEFLFQEASITGNYANEFVASVHKNIPQETTQKYTNNAYQNNSTKQMYSIGDEWLYYKFYCGDKIAEKVLQEAILPAVNDLKTKELIDKWFFIRYIDKDGFHLRFRIKLKDKTLFSKCINSIKYHLAPMEQEGLVWKTQIDQYLRETERYGYESIEDTETFFHVDSESTLQFINLIEGEKGEEVRWLFSLLSIDRLLEDFDCSLKEKAAIMNLLKINFGKEFNRKGLLNKQINDLYKSKEKSIETFLNAEQKSSMYQPLWDVLQERSSKLGSIPSRLKALDEAKKLPSPLALGMLPSYIHMICNRIFLNKQRIHEMVVYDFLFKYYNKQIHTQKHKVKS